MGRLRGIGVKLAALTFCVLTLIVFQGADAFANWTASSSSASGYSKALTMPTGAKPVTALSGAASRNVTVTWAASTIGGVAVSGYTIARYTTGGVPQTIGAGCTGTIAALTCTENNVPTGTWKYGVTPVKGAWTGTEGTRSNNLVVSASMTINPPTTFSSLPATFTGTLTHYDPGETVTFHLGSAGGTLLTGSINPDPIPAGGSSTFSVTLSSWPAGASQPIFAVGSINTSQSATVTLTDNVAPTISTPFFCRTGGGTPGYVKAGGTYRVYATVTDASPSSGISTITANLSNITTGQSSAALTANSNTACGISFTYRSASLTADAGLTAGSKTYSITASDASANSTTSSGLSVTVDNTAPSATDIQTTNASGGTVGKAEAGDTIVYTYSEAIEPITILAGWDGTSTSVTVSLNNGAGAANDTLTVTGVNLGTVNLGRNDYTAATRTFTSSTMVMSGSTITITLGTASGAVGTAASTGTMVWTPSASATDPAGNACSVTPATESGAADKEF